jgi:hypothetical protein
MLEQYANNATTTLSAAIISTSATTLTVTSATLFPGSGNFRILIDTELMLVTGVSGTTFTVTRGVEGTTAALHLISAQVSCILTAASLLQLLNAPTLTTPALGVASATSVNKVAFTAPATGSTLTIADGKTFTASNTITLAGTDSSTLNIGAGGTLGSAAFQSSSAFVAAGSSGAPAGSSQQFQYNNSGVLAGTAVLTFDGANINMASGQLIYGGQGATGNQQIQIFSNGGSAGLRAEVALSAASGAVNAFAKARGSLSAKTAVQSGDILGQLTFQGYDGSSGYFTSSSIAAVVDQAVATGQVACAVVYKVRPISTNALTEAFRISSDGTTKHNGFKTYFDDGAATMVGGEMRLAGGHISGLDGTGVNTNYPPTIVAGAGAGTSPTISISGSDAGGQITLTAGVAASASATIFTVTFNNAYTVPPFVNFSPANSTAALLSGATMIYVTSTTTTFLFKSGTTGLTAGTYIWNYGVMG